MNVSRDVIIDLWPLYESGEASEDTRQLIEDFLRTDEEFARLIRESPEDTIPTDSLPPLKRTHEVETLRRTKALVRFRGVLLFIAIFLTFSPLTVYDASWGSGWVIRDHPLLACTLALAAAIAWCFYLLLRRRLSVTGL